MSEEKSEKSLPLPMPPGIDHLTGPMPESAPPIEESVCLKGPKPPGKLQNGGVCAHFWQFKESVDHGNGSGFFEPGQEPKRTRSICQQGDEMDLAGVAIYGCNRYKATGKNNELVQIFKKDKA